MKKVNFGIIGTGQIIRDAYLPILPFLDMIGNVYLYDINTKSMIDTVNEYDSWLSNDIFSKDYSSAFANAKERGESFRDRLKLINDKNKFTELCDVVLITTPPNVHLSNADFFLERGKQVIIEKPIDVSLEAINELESKYGAEITKKLKYIENFVYNPSFQRVKNIVDSGVIGDILSMKTFLANTTIASKNNPNHWRFKKEIAGGGVMYDWAPHTFSTSMLIAGSTDVVDVKSLSTKYAEDVGAHNGGFDPVLDVYNLSNIYLNKNGRIISVLVENSWLSSKDLNEPSGASWISIDGTCGNITVNQIKKEGKKAYLIKTKEYKGETTEEVVPIQFPHDAYYYALKNILEENPDYAIYNNLQFGKKIMKMITTIVEGKEWQKE